MTVASLTHYIPNQRSIAVAGPPAVGALFIVAGLAVALAQVAGALNLLSCGGGTLVFAGLELLLLGTGVGLLTHPTVLAVADLLGIVLFVVGFSLTGTGHC